MFQAQKCFCGLIYLTVHGKIQKCLCYYISTVILIIALILIVKAH